ncbi:putative U1 snrnp [Cryptosporidium canis]|uniref:U1 snrnp n=1 Tax=Cryptosporidium canis TaxID=195482 RepID=A0ABQ8PAD1_9CRYT|nr:putative U1 snrnp [Cryptosporidium canis]KAJ1614748.1 putative U1 snrnp [Cryptosporidium canis]
MGERNVTAESPKNRSTYFAKRTIYINNLNDRISPSKHKVALENIFSKYGKIESIKLFNSYFRKGQAWIKFSNTDSAIKAVKNENATQIFEKYINVTFATKESKNERDAACNNGLSLPIIPESISIRMDLYKEYLCQWLRYTESCGLLNTSEAQDESKATILSNQVLYDIRYVSEIYSNRKKGIHITQSSKHGDNTKPLKRNSRHQFDSLMLNMLDKYPNSIDKTETNNTVFVQIETGSCKEEELHTLFSPMNGFVELRFIPLLFHSNQIHQVAFVDFSTNIQAAEAISKYDDFLVNNSTKIKLSFAKKS